ncbi:MAG: gliding motility lipoprotein GldH [Flavobacteriales bacterium]|nr:gliding motility lipoprotein GldH [Flavobacteriales bacterium]
MSKWYLVLLVPMLQACADDSLYDSNKHFEEAVWRTTDTAVFEVPVSDTLRPLHFIANLRVSKTYAYSNVWVFLYTTSPQGVLTKDTLEFMLADPSGRWMGKGIGEFLEYDIVFKYKTFFPKIGTWRFAFEQGMRSDDLQGISSFGFRIIPTE